MFTHNIYIASAALGLTLASCSTMGTYNTVTASDIGVAQQVLPATVVSAQECTQEASSTSRQMGTGIGAAIGAGAGQLLGKGRGRVASTVGFAAAGALASRYLVDATGKTKCQRLTVAIDGTNERYSFIQPIYKEIGAIPVGCHGNYHHGSKAQFIPDGQSAIAY